MSDQRVVILAVECDIYGYDPYGAGCSYDHNRTLQAVSDCMDLTKSVCSGKAAFLIHTSPFARRACGDPMYSLPEYRDLWRKVQDLGGEIGLHPHEEEPDGSCFYYYYHSHMAKVIEEHARTMREDGITIRSQMIGYYGMNEWITPIAEGLGINVSLNNVGKYVAFSHSNWRGAPSQPYFHSYENVLEPGGSRVLEIPLGVTELLRYEDGLVIDCNSLWDLKRVWRRMQVEDRTHPCFVLLRASAASGRCLDTADRFLRFISKDGGVFATPSDVYACFAGTAAFSEERL